MNQNTAIQNEVEALVYKNKGLYLWSYFNKFFIFLIKKNEHDFIVKEETASVYKNVAQNIEVDIKISSNLILNIVINNFKFKVDPSLI